MPSLYMLVGVPGSGKSTWRKKVDFCESGTQFLSTDDILEQNAKHFSMTYGEAFEIFSGTAEKILKIRLAYAIKHDLDIVWDQTNLTAKVRKKKLNKIPKHYEKIAVWFATDVGTIHRTNESRKTIARAIPLTILGSMLQSFEIPKLDEGFDRIEIIERNQKELIS